MTFYQLKNIIHYCIKIYVQDYMYRGDEWPSLTLARRVRSDWPEGLLFCVFLSLLPLLLSIQCLALLLAYKLFPFDYITSGLLTRKRYRLRFRAASPRAASLIATVDEARDWLKESGMPPTASSLSLLPSLSRGWNLLFQHEAVHNGMRKGCRHLLLSSSQCMKGNDVHTSTATMLYECDRGIDSILPAKCHGLPSYRKRRR